MANLIEQYYAAFNAGNMAIFYSFLADDVVHDINQGEREVGKDAFKRFMDRMNRCYQEKIVDLVVMTGRDEHHAAAEFVVQGTYLATDTGLPEAHGQQYVLPGGAFFEIKADKIARITNYYNLQEWLQQIGA